jgi:hypothetical protein
MSDQPRQLIYVHVEPPKEGHATPRWAMFTLIFVFIAVIAFAAYLAARASKNKTELRSAEATLVAQAAVPLAVSAALM